MNVQLTKPEMEQFIRERVLAGEFPSPEAVVEDALARVMDEEEFGLSDEDRAAIKRADEQFERGEGIDFNTFIREFKKKNGI